MTFGEWFILFWETYPCPKSGLLHGKKGAKDGSWVTKLEKYVSTPDKQNSVLEALRAQIRYSKAARAAGEPKTAWHFPMASVWCNQSRWSEEIESHSDLKSKPSGKLCQCGRKVEVIDKCLSCYDKWVILHDKNNARKIDPMADRLREKYREMKATGTQKEQVAATKAYLRKLGVRI